MKPASAPPVEAARLALLPAPGGAGADYHVGPAQRYGKIGDVPWFSLKAGDTVHIHHRSAPYREKFLISGRGTPSQWIRVLGVPGPNGELPVISGDGATTSANMHYRWQEPTGGSAIQWDGVIQIAVRADDGSGSTQLPGYIEIANLQVQDGYSAYLFTAENGAAASYDGFAACIYARSAQHLLIRDNVLTNCGQGFYNWTGADPNVWWAGLEVDTVLRGNHFYGNGNSGSYHEHQAYTESDGVTIELNWFGPQRSGALGSQIKDRSAGTIVRYNFIEQSASGWDLDLVEPQESYSALASKPSYKQTFVYGNVILNNTNRQPSVVHWNEDHYAGRGRAAVPEGKLLFYDNTVVTLADRSELSTFYVFNVHQGGYDCPSGSLPGTIDVRNNIFAAIPRTQGARAPTVTFGYCGSERFEFGSNWVSPGWTMYRKSRRERILQRLRNLVWGASADEIQAGTRNLISPTDNDPGFVDLQSGRFQLISGSSAHSQGGSLAPEVVSNALGIDLRPTLQRELDRRVQARETSGPGSDLGAFGR